MAQTNTTLPTWLITNAWREIFTRIFENVEVKVNVSPEWLVNPATSRRLKLDLLYPQIGVAVRIEGLQGKQRRQRPSLEEETQQRIRDRSRVEVCRAHGIELIVVDVADDRPQNIFRDIDLSLSRAKERIKDRELTQQISRARATAANLARRIDRLKDLKLYADLWQDRQYQILEPAQTTPPISEIPIFTVGMEVEHSTFGPGVILATTPSNGDTLLTVDFVTAGQKTLAASLVADKLLPR
jgi:hypothetical protein